MSRTPILVTPSAWHASKDFHTGYKVQMHLKARGPCFNLARAYRPEGYGRYQEVATGAALDALSRQRPVRLQGPLQHAFNDDGTLFYPPPALPPAGFFAPEEV